MHDSAGSRLIGAGRLLLVAAIAAVAPVGHALAQAAPAATPEASAATPEATLALDGIVIDDEDPESSVPGPEYAKKKPMQMGYYVMALADKAGHAERNGRHLAAARYYMALAKAVPDRAVSYGKACRAFEAIGDFARAADSCRQALGKGGVSVDDHLRFVRVTLQLPGTLGPEQVGDIEAILTRLEQDVKERPIREAVAYLRCDVGLRLEQASRLDQCVASLRALGAKGGKMITYEWSLAMLTDDPKRAAAIIERAREYGLADSAIQTMQARLDQAHPPRAVDPRWVLALLSVVGVLLAFGVVRRLRQRSRSSAPA